MTEKDRYFVLDRDNLSDYGEADGYETVEETNTVLDAYTNLVVIKGRILLVCAVDDEEKA